MAKDDYHVIVYKILSYLYACYKKGRLPVWELLMYDGMYFQIHPQYWMNIFRNLTNEGYIDGIHDVDAGGGYYIKDQLPDCRITPKGIDYLFEDTLLEKAKEYIQEINDYVPKICQR